MVRLHYPNTETETDTDKLTQNPMGVWMDVCLFTAQTATHNSIQPICISLGVR